MKSIMDSDALQKTEQQIKNLKISPPGFGVELEILGKRRRTTEGGMMVKTGPGGGREVK